MWGSIISGVAGMLQNSNAQRSSVNEQPLMEYGGELQEYEPQPDMYGMQQQAVQGPEQPYGERGHLDSVMQQIMTRMAQRYGGGQ